MPALVHIPTHTHTHTHTEIYKNYCFLHCKNGFMNKPQCYVIPNCLFYVFVSSFILLHILYIPITLFPYRSLDGSVGTATRLRTGRPWNCGFIPDKGNRLFPKMSGDHKASYFVSPGSPFFGVKESEERSTTPSNMRRGTNAWSYTSIPPTPSYIGAYLGKGRSLPFSYLTAVVRTGWIPFDG